MSLCYSFCRLESVAVAAFEAVTNQFLDGASAPLVSCRTIVDWYSFCREIITEHFFMNQKFSDKIGGSGVVV